MLTVERVPSAGRGKAAQFIPIRFISFNKLGKDDKLLLAFDSGVNVSVGLPILRTSVDNGTAFDIAGTGKADPRAAIISAAVPLLRAAAFFQLFDGLQVTATGALRGAGDTRTPMYCHFAGYWVIGLPLGTFLCFRESLGATGLWAGLSVGLILIGIFLFAFWRRTARRLTRMLQ